MRHWVLSGYSGVLRVRQASSCGGSAVRISQTRRQRSQPERLLPRNRAPGAGAAAGPSHLTRRHSWLHSPVRVTSATTRQTASGGASARVSACPVLATPRAGARVGLAVIIPPSMGWPALLAGRVKAQQAGDDPREPGLVFRGCPSRQLGEQLV